jgi:hypothetical protein
MAMRRRDYAIVGDYQIKKLRRGYGVMRTDYKDFKIGKFVYRICYVATCKIACMVVNAIRVKPAIKRTKEYQRLAQV